MSELSFDHATMFIEMERRVKGHQHSTLAGGRTAQTERSGDTSKGTKSLIHKKRSLHTCSICGYQSDRKANLEQHLRVHTGERPFKCELCSKAFTQRSTLKRHLDNVHGKSFKRRNRFQTATNERARVTSLPSIPSAIQVEASCNHLCTPSNSPLNFSINHPTRSAVVLPLNNAINNPMHRPMHHPMNSPMFAQMTKSLHDLTNNPVNAQTAGWTNLQSFPNSVNCTVNDVNFGLADNVMVSNHNHCNNQLQHTAHSQYEEHNDYCSTVTSGHLINYPDNIPKFLLPQHHPTSQTSNFALICCDREETFFQEPRVTAYT